MNKVLMVPALACERSQHPPRLVFHLDGSSRSGFGVAMATRLGFAGASIPLRFSDVVH